MENAITSWAHSPGPSMLSKTANHYIIESPTEPDNFLRRYVATPPGLNGFCEANAKLIAESPNLYEACLQLVEAYENGERNGGSVDWNDLDMAFNAAKVAIDRLKRQRSADDHFGQMSSSPVNASRM